MNYIEEIRLSLVACVEPVPFLFDVPGTLLYSTDDHVLANRVENFPFGLFFALGPICSRSVSDPEIPNIFVRLTQDSGAV